MKQPSRRVLLGTLVSSGDPLPTELVLQHQLRSLSGADKEALRVVVLFNRPPWLTDAQRWAARGQAQALRRLWDSGSAELRAVNYSVIDDAAFLRRLLVVGGPPGAEKAFFHAMAERTDLGSGTRGDHMVANLLGMLHFLDTCIRSDSSTELCVYLDPDVFLHRFGARGLADLAPPLFAQSPDLVALQPPSLCHSALALQGIQRQGKELHGGGDCVWTPQGHLSQRYIIFNRTRLAKVLPLRVSPTDLSVFEKILFHAIGVDSHGNLTRRTGRMLCGWQTFAIHPTGRLTPGGVPLEDHVRAIALAARRSSSQDHPAVAVPPPGLVQQSDAQRLVERDVAGEVAEGTRLLIERLEAGRFVGRWFEGLTGNKCEDMNASLPRIQEGLAW